MSAICDIENDNEGACVSSHANFQGVNLLPEICQEEKKGVRFWFLNLVPQTLVNAPVVLPSMLFSMVKMVCFISPFQCYSCTCHIIES